MTRPSELDRLGSGALEDLMRQGDVRVTAEHLGRARAREIAVETTQEERDREERRQAGLTQLFADLDAYPSPVPAIREQAEAAQRALGEMLRLLGEHQEAMRTFRSRSKALGVAQSESHAVSLGHRTLRWVNPAVFVERLAYDVQHAAKLSPTNVRRVEYHPALELLITGLDRSR
jgi:hypothetical protein